MPNGQPLFFFPDANTELVKIDFSVPAGAAFQQRFLQAAATNALLGEATLHHTAPQLAEWFDYRGITLDRGIDSIMSTITVYSLRKYIPELLPLLHELLTEPLFGQQEFTVYMSKRLQQLKAAQLETGKVARNLFYADIFGRTHPYGSFAEVEDVERLSLADVQQFYSDRYPLNHIRYYAAGACDKQFIELFAKQFGQSPFTEGPQGDTFDPSILSVPTHNTFRTVEATIPDAVQSTLRIGRLLPWRWDSREYALFTIVNTILGGYFGSRLMSNIREDKGFTYGVASYTHMMRNHLLFFINTDVGAQHAQPALSEIYREMDCLCNEPIPNEELDVVRHYLIGDFLRSIDGIFERSERYRSMQIGHIDERFTDNFLEAISTCTPQQLQEVAQQAFRREAFTQVVVGPEH